LKTKSCVIDDDEKKLYQEIVKSDGVILGSPAYFQSVTAQMKTFIDRIGFLCVARVGRTSLGRWGKSSGLPVARDLLTCAAR
jgi:multimeric flavodoxin WrbA